MKNQNNKAVSFIKRNKLYLILALCIVAVGLSITFMLVNDSKSTITIQTPEVNNPVETPTPSDPTEKPEGDTPSGPVVEQIEFVMPVLNPTSITEYSETLVFNSTLNRYNSHMAIDFFAPEGTSVFAVYGGTIKSVENSLLSGITVTIDHGEGLYTVYNSLSDIDDVSVGQVVAQGEKIGEVSVSNRQEYKEGAHLHFQVLENGEVIDPVKYLAIIEK